MILMTPEEARVLATFAASMQLEDWEMLDGHAEAEAVFAAVIDTLDARVSRRSPSKERPMTTAELIAELRRWDPSGSCEVEAVVDDLQLPITGYVYPEKRRGQTLIVIS